MSRPSEAARPITVFLADTSPEVLAQVRAWAESSEGLLRVDGFANARELTRRMAYQQPDLLLLDVTLPRFDGLTAIRALKAARTPVVLMSPDTVEGARLTMQALLDGASDYLIKRPRGSGTHLAVSRARFYCGIRRLLGTHWAAEVAPCLGERQLRGQRLALDAAGEPLATPPQCTEGWVRLEAGAAGLHAHDAGDPFEAGEGSWSVAFATARALHRLSQGLALAPERPPGPVYLFVPQPRHFARGLREVLSRRWNRVVLELSEGEIPRAGQWRLVPGRALLHPVAAGEALHFALQPNRLVDDNRATGRQLHLLEPVAAGRLRVLLMERPGGPAIDPLLRLLRAGHAVFVHADALAGPEPAGAGTWLEGLGEWVGEPCAS